ncbi:hypothetical protein [Qipengyuania sp. JC766]|uniref:TPM domain-containing protein n=1 Tax=Qipengyuania sp. JC766 TaxID=3232139 RepID=UPI003458831C
MGYLDEAGHRVVSDAVAEAELGTSGEIVTVLADRSDGYSDVVLVWAAALSILAMSIVSLVPRPLLDLIDAALGGWGHEWTSGEAMAVAASVGALSFVLFWLLLSADAIRFAILPGSVRTQRVHAMAIRHFKVGAERRTHGRTGVLIYLSMREHRAEIVADEPIAAKVDAEVWGDAMGDMLVEIRDGRIAEGLAAGIRDVGEILAEHFPREADDENELPDRLIEV